MIKLIKGKKYNKHDIAVIEEKTQIQIMLENLNRFYSNKSTDEYKIMGDITKSPCYDRIEVNLANLSTIKRYSTNDAKSLKTLFNTLHRPRFTKMAAEYMKKPTEMNVIFTACFTVGYRLLVSELSRIVASTQISEKGFIYKPDKIQRKENFSRLINYFNDDLEPRIDAIIRRNNNKLIPLQESAVTDVANIATGLIESVFGVFNNIFRSAASLNPISLMSAILSRSYDKKVEKYEKIAKEYEMARKAYEEWQKIPVTNRKERVGHRYVKMIERYNIKMEKIKKEIEHFDMRSQEEIIERSNRINTKQESETIDNVDNQSSNNTSGFTF